MRFPSSLVAESFAPPGDPALDFDAVGAPRGLRPRPVEADPDARRALGAGLAWFWNSNEEWADEQIGVGDDYGALARRLVASAGLREGDRAVLSASEPDDRREAWRNALPGGVGVSDWRPRRDGRLALEDLDPLLGGRTRLVLLTKACPVTGALNEVIPVARRLSGTGAALVVEASHFAAHGSLDIRNLRCDGLILAGDELFGAGGAAAWSRRLGGEDEPAAPGAMSGLSRFVSYAERLGGVPGAPVAPPSDRFGRRAPMRQGMQGIRQQERILSRVMLRGLSRLSGIRVLGERDPARAACRTPAFTLTVNGGAASLGEALGSAGARVAAGDLGSAGTLAALGVDPGAGAVRVSLAHYHTREEIGRFLALLESLR